MRSATGGRGGGGQAQAGRGDRADKPEQPHSRNGGGPFDSGDQAVQHRSAEHEGRNVGGGHGQVRVTVPGRVSGAGRGDGENGMHRDLTAGQPQQGAARQQVREQQDRSRRYGHRESETANARQAPRGGDVRAEAGRDLRAGSGGGARTTRPGHRD